MAGLFWNRFYFEIADTFHKWLHRNGNNIQVNVKLEVETEIVFSCKTYSIIKRKSNIFYIFKKHFAVLLASIIIYINILI